MPKRTTIREPCSKNPYGFAEYAYRIVRKLLPQNQHSRNWGLLDPIKRVIYVHSKLSRREEIGTVIHEVAHGACPDLAEEAILRLEWSITEALYSQGYVSEEDE